MKFRKLITTSLMAAALAIPAAMVTATPAHAGIYIQVGFAPPALPVYVQPAIPGDGYIWTPGYWAYGDAGYYWVPGVWIEPPTVGVLWTPGYWGYEGGFYGFHEGYWGPHIGFYGGVNYGFGYGGVGFFGGEWRGGRFAYNTAYANVGSVHITNVYVNRVTINNTVVNHASYNGPGGYQARPTAVEQQAASEHHVQPTSMQAQHQTFASQDRSQLASVNNGRPATTATSNPAAYHQVAQQHAQAQPISAADRTAGKTYNPNTREANQQQRIANGDKNGQLNSRQNANIDQHEANVDRQVANDRAANGGKLTPQEHQQVNHEQNQESKQIYNDKHSSPAPRAAAAPKAAPAPRAAPAPTAAPAPRAAAKPAPAPRESGEGKKR